MNDDLIKRVFDILDTFNHWDIISLDYTPEQLAEDMKTQPEAIINTLTEIIEDLI